MRMMMLVGDIGKAQAAIKADPSNKNLPRDLASTMKSMSDTKVRVAELEKVATLCFCLFAAALTFTVQELAGGVKQVGGSALISLKAAQKAVDLDPLRGVAT